MEGRAYGWKDEWNDKDCYPHSIQTQHTLYAGDIKVFCCDERGKVLGQLKYEDINVTDPEFRIHMDIVHRMAQILDTD